MSESLDGGLPVQPSHPDQELSARQRQAPAVTGTAFNSRRLPLLDDLCRDEPSPNLAECFAAAGMIDPKLIYMHERGGATWSELVADKSYTNHDECLEAQLNLMCSPDWRSLSAEFGRVIDLGVGTGDKISRLATELLFRGAPKGLRVLAVDCSLPMLENAIPAIRRNLGRRVRVAGARCDFSTQLGQLRRRPKVNRWLEAAPGRSLFALLGNTICNFCNESLVFKTLASATDKGDIVLFSMELASLADNNAQSASSMMREYQTAGYAEFIFAAMKILYPKGLNDFQNAMTVYPSRSGQFSEIPKAISLVTFVEHRGRLVKLLHSNRHDLRAFSSFTEQFGFVFRTAAHAGSNPFYSYLAFERI